MLKTYKYILKLHHVENGEYSIIHLLSPTCTSLDNLKSSISFFLNLFECILNMWLINIIMIKLKIIVMSIIKLNKHFYFQYIKTYLWLLVFFLWQGVEIVYFTLSTPSIIISVIPLDTIPLLITKVNI
jgi:hypothetical protein